MTMVLRGRRSIWWGCRVTLPAPRIGNDVSYVTRIIDDVQFAWQAAVFGEVAGWLYNALRIVNDVSCVINDVSYVTQIIDDVQFAWQVQYLVRLAGDFSWQAQHFVTFWEIAGTRKVVFYNTKIVSQIGPGRFPKRRVRDDDFMLGLSSNRPFYWRKQFRDSPLKCWPQNFVAGAVFGEVGGWLCLLRALEMTFHMCRRSLVTFILRGRRSIWCGWMLTVLAPRIGNDVSYVTQIINDIYFARQVQYLVRLQGDFTCSTHWKWRFICDADHQWHSFCVAGAIFGEVGGWLYWLHALEMMLHMWCRSLMPFILRGRRSIWWSWTVTVVALRIVNDVSK